MHAASTATYIHRPQPGGGDRLGEGGGQRPAEDDWSNSTTAAQSDTRTTNIPQQEYVESAPVEFGRTQPRGHGGDEEGAQVYSTEGGTAGHGDQDVGAGQTTHSSFAQPFPSVLARPHISAYSHLSYSHSSTALSHAPYSSQAYAHPLYSRRNAARAQSPHPSPSPSPVSSAYSHPAYASNGFTQAANTARRPFNLHLPGRPPALNGASSADGTAYASVSLPPLQDRAQSRQSLPSLAVSTATGLSQHEQPLSATSGGPDYQYPPQMQPPYSLSYTSQSAAVSQHPQSEATTFANPAYSRASSTENSPFRPTSPTSAVGSGGSTSSLTTAASALSSLSAAASAAASCTNSALPKPSTSSSVPNSPWAGPPPPANLSLGGLAKRRRSATDSVSLSGGYGSKQFAGYDIGSFSVSGEGHVRKRERQTGWGIDGLRQPVEEEDEDLHNIGGRPAETSKRAQSLAQRRGSGGTLVLPALSLSASLPASSSGMQVAPPPSSLGLSPRTVVLQNPNGSTSLIKEPRTSSPMQPSFSHPPAYCGQNHSFRSVPLSHPSLDAADVVEPAAPSHSPSPSASTSSAGGSVKRGRKRKATTEEENHLVEPSLAIGAARAGSKAKEKTEKKFICPHPSCGRAFARNFNLQSHIKSHQGIREFKCPECDKLFSRKHDCTRHCIAIHGYDKDFMAQAASQEAAVSAPAVAVKVPIHIPVNILPVSEMVRQAQEKHQAAPGAPQPSLAAPPKAQQPLLPRPLEAVSIPGAPPDPLPTGLVGAHPQQETTTLHDLASLVPMPPRREAH
ncbi:hypothetical protein JCM11641_005600 [Rhodosporidiobolus odoratus]